jgi:hypothetical protein
MLKYPYFKLSLLLVRANFVVLLCTNISMEYRTIVHYILGTSFLEVIMNIE